MKATKLKSGNWRALAFYVDEAGERHRKSFTAPTKKEAELKANLFVYDNKEASAATQRLEDAMRDYIKIKTSVLSPTTLTNYERMIKFFPVKMLKTEIGRITSKEIDSWIHTQAEICSPKTVRNRYGFFHKVMKHNGIALDDHRMPQKEQLIYKIPTDKDIRTLLEYAKKIEDEELTMIILLGAYCGMRRGEMCGLTPADVDGNIIHVHETKVNAKGGQISKGTKNVSSDRYIQAPRIVIDALKGKEEFLRGNPERIYRKFKAALAACDLPDYRLHDLRHFCVSVLHANGCPDVYVQKYCGFSSDKILKAVYRNVMDDYDKMFADQMNTIFDRISN